MEIKKHFDIVVVGELNVDIILNQIEQFPVIGKEILADKMTVTLGSSSAIFASNASTLGAKVAYIGKIGNDSFGELIIERLESKGVITNTILRDSEHSTGATIVLNFDEDRAMVTYPGAMNFLTIQDINESLLKEAKHMHLSSIFLQKGLITDIIPLFKWAKSLGLTTSLDPQWDPAEQWAIDLEALLPYVDVFLPNITELKNLTKTNDLNAGLNVLKPYANTVIVKCGSDGAYLWNGHELLHQKAFLNIQVTDSIGAGDSFDSGFIYQYIHQKSLNECLEYGALMGAINTTRSGGTAAFSSMDSVKSTALSDFNFNIK
jgi:sugar/nucleoside kinase (ribokinase family)